ncbi:unnamed protein product [Penicillium salamii]|uniref:NACHT domain-containing protein n=1 Tax=Penicillium salamii TaxID=1612424 RepID=A0A9W4IZX7_9EURO|nr:unnamed protein product [Penicillium salamii]CAG8171345.1 unnamed protein product [Penicillium salamii]CAG8226718.1 unnamed protein product [Penicillium salamii]CAG8320421.1 unnamed protein product [Penicillium salamii]CAG8371968.1 unnamed protein product [Penicillium salamii]
MTALYNGIAYVNERILWYSNMTDRLLSPRNSNTPLEQVREFLDSNMLDLYQSLLFYQIKSVCFYYRNQLWAVLRSMADLDDWNGELSAVTESEVKLHRDLNLYKLEQMNNDFENLSNEFRQFSMAQIERGNLREDKQCMKDLFKIDPRAEIREIQKAKGEPIREIYDWILKTEKFERFMNWENPESPSLLKINGQAGTGKTMMSVGLIQELLGDISDVDRPEIIYFFIQDIGEEFNNSASILRSLMWLLLAQNPALISHLRPHYDQTGPALFQNSQCFADILPIFRTMLQDTDLGRVLVIFDALDECKGPANEFGGLGRDIFDLLNELLQHDEISSKIKVLITTRPLLEIDTMVRRLSPHSNVTIQLDDHSLSGPINIFIEYQRRSLEAQAGKQINVDNAIQQLKENAGRTFIWVYLVCDQLLQLDSGQWKQTLENAPPKLESLYQFLLDRLSAPAQSRWFGYCKKVLLIVMLAYRPLTLKEMEAFIDPPSDISLAKIVQDCRSFLVVHQDTVFPIHKSAIDYIRKNREVLSHSSFDELHHEILQRALALMTGSLRRNMYDLACHGVSIEEAQAPGLSSLHSIGYFCQHWIDHLKESRLKDPVLQDSDILNLDKFFHVHFLHWLEALSLLHVLPVAMDTVNDLLSLLPFLIDAKRFLARFSPIIAEAPLQTYVSTLVFAPEESKVRENFHNDKPHWVSRVRPSDSRWSTLIRSIQPQGWTGYYSVAVSPKGDIMVAASGESVDVFNMATGTLVRRLKTDSSPSISFSPCEELLSIYSAKDRMVNIWDTSRWKHVKALVNPDKETLDCAFSPLGGAIATASSKKITLWELATGNVVWSRPHRSEFGVFVSFSPEGHVVSDFQHEARLYHRDSGHPVSTVFRMRSVEDSSDSVRTVSYSKNGSWVALRSRNEVRVLNLSSGDDELSESGDFRCVAFSPDSRLLAIGGLRDPIRIWDTKTWNLLQTLEATDFMIDLVFPANNQVLVSASLSGNVSIWDVASVNLRDGQEGDPRIIPTEVLLVQYSPTGKCVASAHDNNKLAAWDPDTGKVAHTRELGVLAKNLLFSPDGEHLLAYLEHKFRKPLVLNAKTGEIEQEILLDMPLSALKPCFLDTPGGIWLEMHQSGHR